MAPVKVGLAALALASSCVWTLLVRPSRYWNSVELMLPFAILEASMAAVSEMSALAIAPSVISVALTALKFASDPSPWPLTAVSAPESLEVAIAAVPEMSALTIVLSVISLVLTVLKVAKAPRPWPLTAVRAPESLEVATAAVLEMSALAIVPSVISLVLTVLKVASAPRPWPAMEVTAPGSLDELLHATRQMVSKTRMLLLGSGREWPERSGQSNGLSTG
jgi:hypothetical protein